MWETTTQSQFGITTSFANTTDIRYTEEIFSDAVDLIMKILYVIVGGLGVLGNGLIIYLFASKRVNLTPFNILLLNLSLSDLLAGLSIWPYVFIDLKSLRYYSKTKANALCVVVMGQMTYWLATVASLFTLTVISVSRYIFIRHPLKSHFFEKKHASCIVIFLIWPCSLAIVMPNFFSLEYDYEHAICYRSWPEGVNGQVYTGITAILGYGIPIVVLAFTYIGTRQYLWLTETGVMVRPPRSIRKRKAASMLLGALVLNFFICWSPFFVYWILSRTATSIFPDGADGEYARMRIIVFVVFVSLCNTVADPIIYGLRGEDIRRSLQEMRDELPYFASRRRDRARTRSSECPDSRLDEHRVRLEERLPIHIS